MKQAWSGSDSSRQSNESDTMNPKKSSSAGIISVETGKKILASGLLASTLFIHAFIAPNVAWAQTSSGVPSISQVGNNQGAINGGVSATEGVRTIQANEQEQALLPAPNFDAPGASSQSPGFTGPQQSTIQNDPIQFREGPNGSFSINDQNGGRLTVGDPTVRATTSAAASGGVVGGAVQCTAASVLGSILTSSIRSAITNLLGGAVRSVVSSVISPKVPVDVQGPVAEHIIGDVQAKTGSFTFGSIFKGVSWDSIAWCIVNSMIEQIANSTIAWANSGFNGNPAFIQNPERFFSDLADQTAGSIIKDIAYGGTGINVCQPFKVNLAIGLAQNYSAQQTPLRGLSCRLSDITQKRFFGGFTTSVGGSRVSTAQRPGNITWDDWIQVSQRDQNNPYGAQIMANQILYAGVSQRQNTVQFEVGMNNGWLNFKKCKDPKNPKSCDIVTPGRLIESQLNSTLDQSKQRLVMAQKFDQMVTAIVNNLIKVALNKVLTK